LVNFSELLQKYSIAQQTTATEVCRYFRFHCNIITQGVSEILLLNFSELLQKYSITQQTTVTEVCRYFRFHCNIFTQGVSEILLLNFSELLQKYSITQQTTVTEVCRYFRFHCKCRSNNGRIIMISCNLAALETFSSLLQCFEFLSGVYLSAALCSIG
jgi:hypothetical protein